MIRAIEEHHDHKKFETDKQFIEGREKIHDSLLEAVDMAGGSGVYFALPKLERMTAWDFLSILGINGIRFIYEPSHSEEKEGEENNDQHNEKV
jgi:hypothetical protein